MRILAFESTAVSASVALMEDEKLVGEFFINTKLTHSRTLMPMAASLLQASGVSLQDIDYFAVAHGPGSFTGVRIGVATVKGLAAPNDVPCCPVSSLLSMAYNLQNMEGVVCAVMDARCHQVYNALFRVHDGVITRLCEDRAIEINQLAEECRPFGNELILVGDGASLCYHDPAGAFRDMGARLAAENVRFQRASSVATAARTQIAAGDVCSPAALAPLYLRLPQAERELKARKAAQKAAQ